MALSEFTKYWLFVLALIYIFVSSCKFGRAFDDPHLGAAGVFAREYLPQAEHEGEADQYFPRAGIIGTNPALLLSKALECFNPKHIYSSCNEAYRLTQAGELNVPPEYADEYCNGPCITETHHALDCIDGILKHFLFYNGATLGDIRDTIKGGCSYGPKRGNFNVAEHIQADEANANTVPIPLYYTFVLVIMAWRVLF